MQVGHRVNKEGLAEMLENRRMQAGLRPLTWHDFRRTFAGSLLDNGNDSDNLLSDEVVDFYFRQQAALYG